MPHLCAFGCNHTPGVVTHGFPNPDKFSERFKVWINLVGGKLETSSDYEFYKRKRICDIHFTDAHRNRYKRLNALAVPSLYLGGVVTHGFPNPDKFPERFKVWVNLVGGKLETSSDYEFYKRKRICYIHFTDAHRNRYKRLNALAVPSLYLGGSFPSLRPLLDASLPKSTCFGLRPCASSCLQQQPYTAEITAPPTYPRGVTRYVYLNINNSVMLQ